MPSIGELRYDIIADTTSFKKGVTATRQELRQASRVMQQTQTPAEKLENKLNQLDNLYRKGAIDAKTYARAVDQARKKFEQTQRAAGGAGQGVKGMNASFAAIGPALGPAAVAIGTSIAAMAAFKRAVNATTEAIKEQMGQIDEIAKFSARIGTIPEELIAIQLAASEMAGVSEQTTNMALQRMTRRIAEAAQGTGEAKGALEELGVSAKSLASLDPASAFREIAEAISQVENPADQLRLAFKLFDSEGAALVNVLRNGSQGIDDMRKRAEELGLTFSSIDASQVEAANDAIAELDMGLSGLARQASIVVAPSIKILADGLTEAVTGVNSLAKANEQLSMIFAGVVGAGGDYANMIAGVNDIMHLQAGGLEKFMSGLRGDTTESMVQQTGDLWWEAKKKELELKNKNNNNGPDPEAERLKAQEMMNQLLKTGADWAGKVASEYAKIVQETEKANQELMAQGENFAQKFMTPQEEMQAMLREAAQLYEQGAIEFATFLRAVQRAQDEVREESLKNFETQNTLNIAGGNRAGSREAISTIQRARAGDQQVQQKLLNEQKASTKAVFDVGQTLTDIWNELRDQRLNLIP